MRSVSVEHDVVRFVRALRDAGLVVGVEQGASFATALGWIDAASPNEVRLAARATLVSRREDTAIFDAVFDEFWLGGAEASRPRKAPLAPRHDPSAYHRTALVAFMAERSRLGDPEADVPEQAKAASAMELLQKKDFGELTPEEHDALRRALRELRFDPVRRVTRRRIASRRGKDLDPRRLIARAARHGAVVVLPRRARKIKRRPLVVLADISGSMELYSRLLLVFLHGLARVHPLTETFAFGTRLTRITAELRMRSVDVALDHAAAAIVDFAGGTRISDSLRTFNRLYGRRVSRGAVVLVISDGWETGDVGALRVEMQKLSARSHRVIWLNPLLGRTTYRPEAGGMAAALEYVDDFMPVHDFQSLKDLSAHLARLPARKNPARQGGDKSHTGEKR